MSERSVESPGLTDEQVAMGHVLLRTVVTAVEGCGSAVGYNTGGDAAFIQPIEDHPELFPDADLKIAPSVRQIIARVRLYNAISEDTIPLTQENVTAMFSAFAANVIMLSEVISPSDARRLAAKTDATKLIDDLRRSHRETGITISRLATIRRRSIDTDPARLDGISRQQEILSQQTIPQLSDAEISEVIYFNAAEPARIERFITTYNTLYTPTYRMVKSILRYATESEVKHFFANNLDNPVEEALTWAIDVRNALDSNAGNPYVSGSSMKAVMQRKAGQTGEQAFGEFMKRVKYMEGQSQRLGEVLPSSFLARWAAINTLNYDHKIPAHMTMRLRIQAEIRRIDHTVPQHALNLLAFKQPSNQSTVSTARRYISHLRALHDDTEGNPWVTTDQIYTSATASTLRGARKHLSWLIYLNRYHALHNSVGTSLDQTRNNTASESVSADRNRYDTIAAPAAYTNTATTQEQGTRMAQALDELPQLEAEALKIIFGMSSSLSEREVAEKLNVPLKEFEAYVKRVIMPKITTIT